jgi:hypothetical protein
MRSTTAALLVTATLALAGPAALAAAGPALAADKGDHLNMGDSMYPGDSLSNPAGTKLAFQTDGNLVEYRYDGRVCWASDTKDRGGNRLTYQSDGNLVMYTDNTDNHPVWASNTSAGWPHDPVNVNINARGEVWVGYDKLTNACE